jgi:Xaa-Pro aminopeptidase
MELSKYQEVQVIAKEVLSQLEEYISEESTEESIAIFATQLLAKLGATDTWYHNVPALVLLGKRSCLSISGKEYTPAKEAVGLSNLVTVDLSPSIDQHWGDCSRSYCIEEGRYIPMPKSDEFVAGLRVEKMLHDKMIKFVSPETRFLDLFEFGNNLISDSGYENLDFLSNLGHSIETDLKDRKFIDKSCSEKLGSVQFFTFEPHIRKRGTSWGFKHENIYYFDSNGNAIEL